MPTSPPGKGSSVKKLAVVLGGGALVLVGIAALVLPGPGLLLILLGLVVLSTEFEWAEKRVDWVRDSALTAAAEGVQTWPRVGLSTLSALFVIAVGVVWGLAPRIPRLWIFGPELPLAGWGTGGAIIAGGILAVGLLIYSVKRFRIDGEPAPGERDRQPA